MKLRLRLLNVDSNTILVKVKFMLEVAPLPFVADSNTTLVNVKC